MRTTVSEQYDTSSAQFQVVVAVAKPTPSQPQLPCMDRQVVAAKTFQTGVQSGS